MRQSRNHASDISCHLMPRSFISVGVSIIPYLEHEIPEGYTFPCTLTLLQKRCLFTGLTMETVDLYLAWDEVIGAAALTLFLFY